MTFTEAPMPDAERLVAAIEKARRDLLDIMGLVVDAPPEKAEMIYRRVNDYAHRASDDLAEAVTP